MLRITVHFVGRVQGVGFRYTTRGIASRFAVAGYMQNLPDGRVRAVAEGEPPELDAFIAEVVSRMDGYIEQHTVDRADATGEFGAAAAGSFEIRY